ncbi:hypothetical protein F2Q69_00030771 [Brassica cretica]|uniref:Uncharacterized protein n=1 Tax=Brassica cretica TaxID=69181 RepID=A0A8S9S6S7_BRACR|nr:hypothetical protein F2Q69_00030771 [Brassica cretica]
MKEDHILENDTIMRQGEGNRLQEEKGSSYPKQTSSKNSTASHGHMELVASLCVGKQLVHFIQWMLDLISLNQAQWKNGIRMGLDKVRWSGFFIWYKVSLSYSLVVSTKCTVVWRWSFLLLLGLTKESRARDLRWSLIMSGGARFGVMGVCWIIAGEHTPGLVSLNQVQRIYGTMIGIKLVSSVKLQDGSGHDGYTVSPYRGLFRTCSKHASSK